MIRVWNCKTLFLFFLAGFCIQTGFLNTLWAQSSPSGLPFVRNFKTLTYKAGIQNYDIAQDNRGIIYVANNFGLLEYDGDQWQIYGVESGTKVRSVAIDSRGRVYVGSQADFGFFFPNSQGEMIYNSLVSLLAEKDRNFDEVWSVYIDRELVYFCTFSSIFVYDGSKITTVQSDYPVDLCFLINRNLYVNQRNVGLGVVRQQTIQSVPGGEFLGQMSISSVLPLGPDQLLISTFNHGIFLLENGKASVWNAVLQDFFLKININCMVRMKNGNLAAGTQNNGLLVLSPDGQLVMHLTRGRGLDNRTVLSLMEDDLGNLWVGHNNGIAYVELGSPFSFIGEQSGLPGTGYSAYLKDDVLYACTNTGIYRKPFKSQTDFELIQGTAGQAYHIAQYGNDLLAGHHNGPMRIEGNKATHLSGNIGSWVFLALPGNQQKLIEGNYTGLNLLDKAADGHWQFEKKIEGFWESSRVMALDDDQFLWVTHGYKGAYRIKLDAKNENVEHVAFYGMEKGFPSNRLINVFKIRNELLFTGEEGVYRFNKEKDAFEPDDLFTTQFGRNAQFWYLCEDALGNIYFLGREHIGAFIRNTRGEYVLHAHEFNKIRKYLNDDLENITILKNNEVLFGAKDGFVHYNPAVKSNTLTDFYTLIRRVSISHPGDSAIFSGNYVRNDTLIHQQWREFVPVLDYKHNSLKFTYSATSYEGDADLMYQYYLDNFDDGWSAWETKTQKEYTNLKEGKYVFYVRSRNVNGEISNEAMYEFKVSPPWYRSLWAYLVYALSGVGFLLVGFNIMDRKYQRKQLQMSLRQKQELTEKNQAIEQLSQQSQEEINKLQNEKLESELQHMNNELATATMHLLNKNEFITSVKNSLSHIAKADKPEQARKDIAGIVRDIENNISNDTDWEHFQFHFDRVHGDFSTRFKGQYTSLSPQDIKLSAYLRMNLSSKEIAQLLNISVRGVEISRYRLRKKLQLDRNQNLQDFILNF